MPVTYKKSGVDIDKGNALVKRIKPLSQSTKIPGVVSSLGGFASFFDPKMQKIKNPLLVSSTDGVGTKLEVANLQKKHDTIGIDLVAMCVNDLIVTGAKPIFFLDYFAVGKLELNKAQQIIKGIAKGCKDSGCALVGGETAEMPGIYPDGKYDLAGFSVGLVDKKKVITGKSIKAGDVLIGLASTGPHSNGFSLIRKIFSKKDLQGKWGREVLKPTQLYVKPVLKAKEKFNIKGIVHITGGGFYDNIPRVLPKSLGVQVDKDSWKVPSIFNEIQKRSKLNDLEMYRTFNMGIGLVLVVPKNQASKTVAFFKTQKLKAYEIGQVTKTKKVELI